MNLKKIGWWSAAGILTAVIVTEALPVVVGIGQDAVWPSWGFLYITMRWIVIPLSCLVHIVYITVRSAIHFRRLEIKGLLLEISSILISGGYLIALYLKPLPWLAFLCD